MTKEYTYKVAYSDGKGSGGIYIIVTNMWYHNDAVKNSVHGFLVEEGWDGSTLQLHGITLETRDVIAMVGTLDGGSKYLV